MDKALEYSKAIFAAVGSGLTVLYTALDSGGVSAQEWVGVAIAVLGVGGGTAAIPNKRRAT